MLYKKYTSPLLSALLILFTLTLTTTNALAAGNTVVDVAYHANHTTWVKAVNSARLTKTFTENGPFTTFVPTEAAFAALNSDPFNNQTQLRQLILHHTIPGAHTADDLLARSTQTTAFGSTLQFSRGADGTILINNHLRIVQRDLPASNGIVHVVDTISPVPAIGRMPLSTPSQVGPNSILTVLANDPTTTLFVNAVQQLGLTRLLDEHRPFTLFVPTDTAFQAENMAAWNSNHTAYRQMMLYHLVLGERKALQSTVILNTALGKPLLLENGRVADQAQVIKSVDVNNGVVHFIDSVLDVPAEGPFTLTSASAVPQDNTLMGQMASDPRLTMFVNEVRNSGMENLLTRKNNFTVFAPTNAAFADMDAELMMACQIDRRLMKQLVLLHLVHNAPQTLAGNVHLSSALGESLSMSGFEIVGTISADNGTVYLIDTVQIPQMFLR